MSAEPVNRTAIQSRPKPADALAAPLLDVGGTLAKLTPMLTSADPSEARSFLTAHPDLEAVDFLLADINGVFRGKRVRPDHLLDIYEDGLLLSKSVFSADITGETADEAGLGFEIGDRDATCRPVAGTLCLNAWNERKLAQAQLLMYDDDGNPYALDPQAVLAGVVEKLGKLGLQPVVVSNWSFILSTVSLIMRRVPRLRFHRLPVSVRNKPRFTASWISMTTRVFLRKLIAQPPGRICRRIQQLQSMLQANTRSTCTIATRCRLPAATQSC